MTKINVRTGTPVASEATAWFVPEDAAARTPLLRDLSGRYSLSPTPFRSGAFSGKVDETLVLFPAKGTEKRLVLVGIGKGEKFSLETIRRGAARAARAAQQSKARSLAIVLPTPETFHSIKDSDLWSRTGEAMAEGILLGLYRYDEYFTGSSNRPLPLKDVTILATSESRAASVRRGVAIGRITSAGAILARDLANAPGNEIYPASLASRAKEAAQGLRIKVNALGPVAIRKLRMGGLLGVAQGSSRTPRFIVMEYNRAGASRGTVALVGKGITFDSGGISIKPSANMAEMKMDMSGAAAVIGTLQTAARLKLPLRLVGLIPAAENLPSGSALKPGDIIRHLNGKTTEVDNTDAEGRLVLADALAYASRYSPDCVIDLATLTGAVVVALGHHATGMLGNDDTIMDRLRESGERTYERVWQLPLFDEYEKQIKSDIADVKNVGGRWAGAITGALFLRKFIGEYRWVHLDIAGTAMLEESSDYLQKGASGVGVRLLTDFLREWKKPGGRRR